ncbi:hypothetical protein FOA43_001594 [Brettanomyces nanus]|uniref:Conserved oligomeric Golgi complex subunit 1 n=1 Tax=Eeniella nana TaxID=13502 RepID=A0A875S382_EENNA|nr:uncharacterized protein FOA43_001594 [Brettanomyces nanus]QPG74269.1 hypothetical protein FOA43_001594 [Brettanomyces nanus]
MFTELSIKYGEIADMIVAGNSDSIHLKGNMQFASYDVSKLADLSADQLLTEYPVQDLEYIKDALTKDMQSRRAELRDLVGSKYRDLLKAADDIVLMDQLVNKENKMLVGLTFRKAEYNSKALHNLDEFHRRIGMRAKRQAQARSKIIVFRNLVHDSIYSYYNIESSLNSHEEEGISSSSSKDKASMQFVLLAEQLYLIFDVFRDLIEDPERQNAFAIRKIQCLHSQLLKDAENRLTQLSSGYEYEFATNIMIAYVILSNRTPKEALMWFLDLRKAQLFQMDPANDFENCLSYIYVTLNFLSVFETRLSTMLTRQIYSSANCNWMARTSLHKWCSWLDIDVTNYTVHYPLSSTQLKITPSDKYLSDQLSNWKLEITGWIRSVFIEVISNSGSLRSLSGYITKVLISFKKFTSLVDFLCKSVDENSYDPMIEVIMHIWKDKYFSILETMLGEFSNISDSIMKNFSNSGQLNGIHTNHGTNLFKDIDIFDIDKFIGEVSNPDAKNSVIEPLLCQIDTFKDNIKAILCFLASLKKSAFNLERPILSIDDTENSEFWSVMSTKVQKLINESVSFSIKKINEAISKFLTTVELSIGEGSHEPIEYLYMIRILLQLKERLDLSSIYSEFTKIINGQTEEDPCETLKVDLLGNPLLFKLSRPLVKQLTLPIVEEIKGKLRKSEVDATEIELWEEYSQGKKLPTSASMDLEKDLYNLASRLLIVDTDDYSDVYLTEEFSTVRDELVDGLIETISNCLKEQKKEEVKTLSLVAYSNLVFLLCFKVPELSEEKIRDQLESVDVARLSELNSDLTDEKYQSIIISYIISHFKTVRLMYYPLS